MASRQETADYFLDQLARAGRVTAKKMFGEYSVYLDGKIVALIADDQFFLKPTAAGRALIGKPREAPPYPGAKPYFLIDGDQCEDAEGLVDLVKATAKELPLPKPKPKSKAKSKESPEIQVIRDFYAALNRNDIPAAMKVFDPKVEWSELDRFPGKTWRGLPRVKPHFAKSRATWAEGACEPERFIVAGDKIVVFSHVRVRLKRAAKWLEGDVTDVFTFRNGKVIVAHSYNSRRAALAWAKGKPVKPKKKAVAKKPAKKK